MFADDTGPFYSHKNIKTLFQIVNSKLKLINEWWFLANKLSLNAKKKKQSIFYFMKWQCVILSCCSFQPWHSITSKLKEKLNMKKSYWNHGILKYWNFSVDSAMSPIMVNVWDTWMFELVNILVYQHLPENKLSLRIAP